MPCCATWPAVTWAAGDEPRVFTLFAIVPVIAVAFAVLKAFGYHRELEPVLFEFLRPLGDQGYRLTASIMGFVENVQGTLVGTIGFAILLYTVVSMIQKVEEALNFNWHVDARAASPVASANTWS